MSAKPKYKMVLSGKKGRMKLDGSACSWKKFDHAISLPNQWVHFKFDKYSFSLQRRLIFFLKTSK